MSRRSSAALAAMLLVAGPLLLDRVSSAQPIPAPSASASARASSSASAPAASSSAAAPAAPAVSADVMVLHATNTAGGIDPRLRKLPQLKKPPFSAYDTYKLLTQSRLALPVGKQLVFTLPNDRVLQITLKETVATAPRDPRTAFRYKVAASISKAKGATFLPQLEVTTSPNEPFFVAGQSYKGGILVVGITLVR